MRGGGHSLSFGTNREPLSILINLLFLNGFVPFCNNNVFPGGWYIGTTVILYCLTPLILLFLKRFGQRKTFFAVSSSIGIIILFILRLIFKTSFSTDGFSYFFFLVHYPEYLLGLLLYYDINEKISNKKPSKIFLLLGFLSFGVAFILYYSSLPKASYLSAWVTALATYLVLYYMITHEDEKSKTRTERLPRIESLLMKFGQNSYGIFLLHAFYAWSFIELTENLMNHIGLSIKNIPGFIIMIPVVLMLCYFTGIIFNRIIKKVTKLFFK